MNQIYQAIAPYAGYAALSILGLFILAILYRFAAFVMGPPPIDYAPEIPTIPKDARKALIAQASKREREEAIAARNWVRK